MKPKDQTVDTIGSDPQAQIQAIQDRLNDLPPGHDPTARADLLLSMAKRQAEIDQGRDAWTSAREAFDGFLAAGDWDKTVACCEILFLSDQEKSLAALGQGLWLAITYPIHPEQTVRMLQHIIDETPANSDGAAIAAATAHYVADLRAQGKKREELMFFTSQMLSAVAERHQQIKDQPSFDRWFRGLELDDPEKLLLRLRNVIDVLVQQDWWLDRDALQSRLPIN